MPVDYTPLLDTWKTQIQESVKEQQRWVRWDGTIYNGGTFLALLCTSTAALWSYQLHSYLWAPRVLSGIATFLVALERAKNYGARYRFHMEIRNEYRTLLDSISSFPTAAEGDKPKLVDKIKASLSDLRRRETDVPGVPSKPHRS